MRLCFRIPVGLKPYGIHVDVAKLMRATEWTSFVDFKAMIKLLLLGEGALLND